jgi:crossover junction endodeoxyribonuclease RusA
MIDEGTADPWALSRDRPGIAYLLDIVVDGDPKAKARPRVGANGNVYTPADTVRAETALARAIRRSIPRGFRKDGDHEWGISAVFKVETRRTRDHDNMLKLVSDALTGLVWVDDVQVAESIVRVVRGTGTDACTMLRVYKLGPRPPVTERAPRRRPPSPRRSSGDDRNPLATARSALSFRRRT